VYTFRTVFQKSFLTPFQNRNLNKNRIMRFTSGSVLLMVGSALALPQDEVRECSKLTCASGSSQVLLSCGGSGEKIKSIRFASFGLPSNTCPGINDDFFAIEDFNVTRTAGCDATKTVKVFEDACVGEEECTVNLKTAFTLTDAGLESCGVANQDQLRVEVFVECGETFDIFVIATALLISVVGLALGASVEVHDFLRVYREHKRAVFVGFFAQFGFMPLIAFTFAKTMDFDPRVAVGMILVGSAPGGTTSNLLTYYAKGSVALSVVMSSCSTLAALFMIPLLTYLYLVLGLQIEEEIAIPFANIVTSLLIAIVPAALGVFIRSKSERIAKKVERIGTAVGALFLLAALALGVIQNPDLFVPSKYPRAWLSAAFFQPIGCLLGYCLARLARLPHPECRAICLETGIQNFVLALAIIALSFSGCDRLVISTFPLISTFFYLVNSIWITAFLRFVMSRFDSDEESEETEKENAEIIRHSVVHAL